MSTKFSWEKGWEQKLATWGESFRPFFDAGGFDPIYDYLRSRKDLGYKVLPDSSDTFRVFQEVKKEELKCIFYLQDPYYQMKPDKDGKKVPIANGVAMDCRNTGKCQPSLINFYEGIHSDLYGKKKVDYVTNPSLEHLTRQGVMLLNIDLTTELGVPAAHKGLWKEFQKFFLEEIINREFVNLPIVFAGKSSQLLARYADPLRHKLMFCEHPAAVSRNGGSKWDTVDDLSKKNKEVPIGVIKKTDYYLRADNKRVIWLEEEAPF